eukprot:scaffold30794_cov79-Isochrysis_galbana.AAC.1
MQRAATLRKERSLKRAARSVEAAAAALGGQEEVLRQREEAVQAEAELVLTAKQVWGTAVLHLILNVARCWREGGVQWRRAGGVQWRRAGGPAAAAARGT